MEVRRLTEEDRELDRIAAAIYEQAAITAGLTATDWYAGERPRAAEELYRMGILRVLGDATGVRRPRERWAEVWRDGPARSLREIEERIMARWGVRMYEAERIVRTVHTSAAGAGTLERLRREGYTRKRWVATRDDRVRGRRLQDRHDHLHMDGQTVPIEEPFRDPRSGELVMYPGDPSLGAGPGMLVNCRCTIVGVD